MTWALWFLFGLPHHIASADFCILVFCFVLFFFVGKINWNCTKTLDIPFGGSRTRIKKWKTQWGRVRARYCAPVHSCAVKWSRYTKWKMTADRLFTSSPCSWSWFKCWSQFRDALHAAGTCFKRAFPQLRSPPSPCQPFEKWCTAEKQREVIFDLPRPLPPKVPDRTASKCSPPTGPNGWTFSCGCAGDNNRSN